MLGIVTTVLCNACYCCEQTSASDAPTTYAARDTLDIQPDTSEDAQECLEGLSWNPGEFTVSVLPTRTPRTLHVRFPSPRPCGVKAVDEVTCEWYAVTDDDDPETISTRPAVIVVHESGSKMVVGRMIAAQLRRSGLHAFLVQLPGYGERRSPDYSSGDIIELFAQGIADVRRARDAVAALPEVDSRHIAIQGTSLGGFVASVSASLDTKFDSVFLLLSGGDLHGVLTTGVKDAQKALSRLKGTGIAKRTMRDALARIEPMRVVHRLSADDTWLYSAAFDRVVPSRNSNMLSEKIGLDKSHHIQMLANHYSGIIYLPGIVEKIRVTGTEHL